MSHTTPEPPASLSTKAGQTALLRIYMLGGLRLLRGDEDLHPERWELQRAVSVFKYLVSEEGRWVPTDVLLDLFWPEAEPERARGALRTTVYALRHALQPELEPYQASAYIEAARGRYRFRTESPHWWDVRAFLDALDRARRHLQAGAREQAARLFDEALALYRGDFLPEDRYEEWTVLPRERLRHAYLEAALQLGELAAHLPEVLSRAVARLREATALAPEREDLQRQLMLLFALSGRMADALRQYEALRQLLQEEFGMEPAPETEELVGRLRRGELPRPEKPALPTPVLPPRAAAPPAASSHGAPSRPIQPLGAPPPGALMVDWATFRRLVHLERRRMQRWQVPVSVLLISRGEVQAEPGNTWDEVELFMDELAPQEQPSSAAAGPAPWQERVARRLRQGDAACPVGTQWLLVLLAHADDQAARVVAGRLAEAASLPQHDGEEPEPAHARRVEVRLVSLHHAA